MIHGDLRDETLADNKILYNSFFFSDISHNTIDGVDFRHSTQSQTYN